MEEKLFFFKKVPGCLLLALALVQSAAGSGCGSGSSGSGTRLGPVRTLHRAAPAAFPVHLCPPPDKKVSVNPTVIFFTLNEDILLNLTLLSCKYSMSAVL